MSLEDIRSWLREQNEAVEEAGALAVVGLLHFKAGGEEVEILSMKIGHRLWGNVDDMSDTFFRIATRHCRGMPGMQQLQMIATFGAQGKPTRFLPFQCQGRLEFGSIPGGLATEPPTEVGMRSQSMRWGEQIVQSTMSSQRNLNESQQKALDSRDKRILQLEQENRELFLALRDELAKTVALAHDKRMKELEFVRATDERHKLIKLLPALTNAVSGREIFPESKEDSALIEALCENVDENEVKMLAQILGSKSPEIGGLIMNRFNVIQTRKREAEEQMRILARSATGNDPLADAGGEVRRLIPQNGVDPKTGIETKQIAGTP
jgi:hypothetical protein